MLTRYTVPGKYDEADFGTIVKVMGDDETYQIYVQVQDDHKNSPHWMRSGEFFEKILNHNLQDNDTRDEYLKMYLYLIK
jgi:hypothetical protein